MLLFFKAIYRDQILRGEKTDTIRAKARGICAGRLVKACVGPSRIFATLRVLEVAPVASLSEIRRAQVIACYGEMPPDAVQLRFELVAESLVHHNPAA